MPTKTLKQVLDTHAETVRQFRVQREMASKPRAASRDWVVKEKEKRLAAMEGRLADARKARDNLVRQLESELDTLSSRVALLKKEIQGDKENLKKLGKKSPKSGGGGKQTQPKPGPGTTVNKIKGVGKIMAERLAKARIGTATEVAAMKPSDLAKILEIAEERAGVIIAEAKKLRK